MEKSYAIIKLLSSYLVEIFSQKGGYSMNFVFDVCIRVMVNVISHLVNKWLDSKQKKDS